ncbi:cyclohexanecarboxylate-CoA ligase [Halieaceae bacterium IMCC14734]|uniref:Cyclohexanecarboxylate-CoA ligase n=1 Tax=Candidatus Litorirhabdus singularis TaxID=2518993 RepID=A0ABT3TCW9_9GAMM|nr:AMP-binding protein [Candidatus Litorirhabdus singularis]MCX2980143.1 cyclohexanecarboxylate-CoA ligase [Candidatus Litorirhabdus singularis]
MTSLAPDRLERDGPLWRNTTIALEAWRKAEEVGHRVAIFLEHEPDATYASLALEARRLIVGLQGLGLQAGDVISFQLPNWREGAPIDIAAAALGLVVNPIVPIYRDAELRYILKDARTKAFFIPEQYRSINYINMVQSLRDELPDLEHLITVRSEAEYDNTIRYEALVDCEPVAISSLPPSDPNAVKCRLYTSGTTGFPKAVLHTHNTLNYVQQCSIRHSQIKSDDVMVMPSPITHITGYSSGLNMSFMSEGRSALMERWDADKAIDYIHRVKGTMTVGATPFLQELLDAAERREDRLPTMRQFSCGGAAVPPQLIRRAYKSLDNCIAVRVYGSTEVPLVTYGWRDDPELAATTDGQLYAYEIQILDDDGNPVAAGEDGEIAARGAGMLLGYADPQQNAEAHTADGFFLTGDIGHLTPEGAVLITDRKKDIIIRGGENLSAKEIEDALHHHPAIREAAVVAMPHPRLGEGVCAFLILRDSATPPTLADIVEFTEAQQLARQKTPERIEVVAELPRTPSGKVRKDVLRKRLKDEID